MDLRAIESNFGQEFTAAAAKRGQSNASSSASAGTSTANNIKVLGSDSGAAAAAPPPPPPPLPPPLVNYAPPPPLPTPAEIEAGLVRNYEQWHNTFYNKPPEANYSLGEWNQWFQEAVHNIGSQEDILKVTELPQQYIIQDSKFIQGHFEKLFEEIYEAKPDEEQFNGDFVNMTAEDWLKWYDDNKAEIDASINKVRVAAAQQQVQISAPAPIAPQNPAPIADPAPAPVAQQRQAPVFADVPAPAPIALQNPAPVGLRDNDDLGVDNSEAFAMLFAEPEDKEPEAVTPVVNSTQDPVFNSYANYNNVYQGAKQAYFDNTQTTTQNDQDKSLEIAAATKALVMEYKALIAAKLTRSLKENDASAIINTLNEYNNAEPVITEIDEKLEASKKIAIETLLTKATNDTEISSLALSDRTILTNLFNDSQHQTKGEVDAAEASQRDLDPTVNAVTGVAHSALSETLGVRLEAIQVAQSEGLGVAAGDEEAAMRLTSTWISGLYGSSIQGSNGSSRAYKGKIAGGAIGVDAEIQDNLTLGLAYSNVISAFNYRQNKGSDKTTAYTHILSLYSQLNFSNAFVWNNIASISRSNVKTATKHDRAIAHGKFKSDGFSFDTNLGYKIYKNNIVFIPSVGLRYDHSKDAPIQSMGPVYVILK